MNCAQACRHFDDYLEGSLSAADRAAVRGHLNRCATCRDALDERLARALESMSIEPPSEDFHRRAFQRLRPDSERRPWGYLSTVAAAALAAGLFVWAALPTALQDDPMAQLTLTVAETETVNLIFNAPSALADAKFVMSLPPGVEIAGYEGERELVWNAPLKPGRNLLTLPVVATAAGEGDLVARIEHESKARTFRVRIEAQPPASATSGGRGTVM